MRSNLPSFLLSFLLFAALVRPAAAQTTVEERLRQSADSLARIREERLRLEREMQQMQNRARDITAEVTNLERQASTTATLVRALDNQLLAISAEVSNSTASLIRAQDELAIKEADLRKRLTDIYRKGPLNTLEVLFSARSFTELLARYKYLRLQTARDKAMVARVKSLKDDIESGRAMRVRLQEDVQQTLAEKEQETSRFRQLEQQRKQALAQVQQSASQTQRRLNQMVADEQRLNTLVENLARDSRARGAGAGGVIAGASVFRAGAALDWPVQGEIAYRFGRAVQANNTEIKWNGIGISAPSGTSVRAVANGRVEQAMDLPGYGRTVVLAHASGDYTIYSSLQSSSVSPGMTITRGQVIGVVGTSSADLGPHLHFEVRLNSPSGPQAVDPLPFLRPAR